MTSHDGSMGQTESGDDCLFSTTITRKEHRPPTDDYTSESSIRRREEGHRKESFVAHFKGVEWREIGRSHSWPTLR